MRRFLGNKTNDKSIKSFFCFLNPLAFAGEFNGGLNRFLDRVFLFWNLSVVRAVPLICNTAVH